MPHSVLCAYVHTWGLVNDSAPGVHHRIVWRLGSDGATVACIATEAGSIATEAGSLGGSVHNYLTQASFQESFKYSIIQKKIQQMSLKKSLISPLPSGKYPSPPSSPSIFAP